VLGDGFTRFELPIRIDNCRAASAKRDALCRRLYSTLLGFVCDQTNKTLCGHEPSACLLVVDVPSLVQNSTNEKANPQSDGIGRHVADKRACV